MRLKEILELDSNQITDRIGNPPYLYTLNTTEATIYAEKNLEYIKTVFKDIDLNNIEVFAYGYKNGDNKLDYIDSKRLLERFRNLSDEGIYECVDENRNLLYVEFEALKDFFFQRRKILVNGKPIDEFMKEEVDERIKKIEGAKVK